MKEKEVISSIYKQRFLSKGFTIGYFFFLYLYFQTEITQEDSFIGIIITLLLALYFQHKANIYEKILKEISKIEKPKEEHKLSKLIREKKEFIESQKKDKE